MLRPPTETHTPVHVRWAALIALGAGLAGVLAFPRFGIWPMAFVSVGLLSIAVHGRRSQTGAWLGLLYGLAFFGPLLHWTGVYVGPVPWLILAVTEAAYCAGMGAMLPVVQRLPGAPVWVGATWVLQEAVRGRWPFGGFPWGRLGFSQAESPLRWFAALGGAPLVSFAVALAGAALAAVTLYARSRSWQSVTLAAAALVAVPTFGAVLAWPLKPAPDRDGRTATIALVQGDVPDRGLDFNSRRRQVLDNHVQQTLQLAADIDAGRATRPSLVVWPENSSDIDPYTNADARAEIAQAVAAVQAPILVGAILDGPGDHIRNVGILWSPAAGAGQTYTKRHPVPFAEYIPLRGLAKLVSSKVDLVSRDMAAGGGNGLLTDGPFPIGDVICFEVAYDGLVRSSVAAGAQLIVVQTNNATFGHSAETYQQLAMSQLRAVEHGRTTVQVSTSGESAIIGPDGGIRMRSGDLFTPSRLVTDVPLRTGKTLATRWGPVPEYVLGASALAALLVSVLHRRRRPMTPTGNTDTEEMVRA
ncbi:MAG: apolipoprotein N-acyltransferase [Actinomycetota bacterium]